MIKALKTLGVMLIITCFITVSNGCSKASVSSENPEDSLGVTTEGTNNSQNNGNNLETGQGPKDSNKEKDKNSKGSNPQVNGEGTAKPIAIDEDLTPIPEGGFSFAIQADVHLDEKTSVDLYKATLTNISENNPEFLIDLGDTFMSEKFAREEAQVEERYVEVKSYFDTLEDTPVYLVNGNHDGEWGVNEGEENLSELARVNRLKYFSMNSDYNIQSGNTETANYYTFVEGEAQFIILDPYTYTTEKTKDDLTGWNNTLGKNQYEWLKTTLENSQAKYKFVFIHNLVGGIGKDSRGGAEAAKFFEWGGYSADGTYEFDTMRSGWEAPIHELLVNNGVTAVFHGHDHFYGKQELDGITYQLVPQPGTPGNSVGDAGNYGYKDGDFLPSAGYIRVVVGEEKVNIEYVIGSLDEKLNGKLAASYDLE